MLNPSLAKALSRKTELTQEEWDAVGIHSLSKDHFIKSGDSYFTPAADGDAAARAPGTETRGPTGEVGVEDGGGRGLAGSFKRSTESRSWLAMLVPESITPFNSDARVGVGRLEVRA